MEKGRFGYKDSFFQGERYVLSGRKVRSFGEKDTFFRGERSYVSGSQRAGKIIVAAAANNRSGRRKYS
jgi:hypothetical protein